MPPWLNVFAIALGIAVGLLVLDRLALWMEARGWIYWRRVKPKGGGVAAGLAAFQQFIEPEVRHVIEEREGRIVSETLNEEEVERRFGKAADKVERRFSKMFKRLAE